MSHPNEQKRGNAIAASPWPKGQENILVDRITELNRAVNNANAELRECKVQLQKHISVQQETQSLYHNQLKHITYLKESREKELLDRIARLREYVSIKKLLIVETVPTDYQLMLN
jgi:wobble nucleotide-excising tRNase